MTLSGAPNHEELEGVQRRRLHKSVLSCALVLPYAIAYCHQDGKHCWCLDFFVSHLSLLSWPWKVVRLEWRL